MIRIEEAPSNSPCAHPFAGPNVVAVEPGEGLRIHTDIIYDFDLEETISSKRNSVDDQCGDSQGCGAAVAGRASNKKSTKRWAVGRLVGHVPPERQATLPPQRPAEQYTEGAAGTTVLPTGMPETDEAGAAEASGSSSPRRPTLLAAGEEEMDSEECVAVRCWMMLSADPARADTSPRVVSSKTATTATTVSAPSKKMEDLAGLTEETLPVSMAPAHPGVSSVPGGAEGGAHPSLGEETSKDHPAANDSTAMASKNDEDQGRTNTSDAEEAHTEEGARTPLMSARRIESLESSPSGHRGSPAGAVGGARPPHVALLEEEATLPELPHHPPSVTLAKAEVRKRGEALRAAIEVLSGSEWYQWERLFTLSEAEAPAITRQVMSGIAFLLLDESPASCSSAPQDPDETKEAVRPLHGTPPTTSNTRAAAESNHADVNVEGPAALSSVSHPLKNTPSSSSSSPTSVTSSRKTSGDAPVSFVSTTEPSTVAAAAPAPASSAPSTPSRVEAVRAIPSLSLPTWKATMACFVHEQFPHKLAHFDVLACFPASLPSPSCSVSSPSPWATQRASSALSSPQKAAGATPEVEPLVHSYDPSPRPLPKCTEEEEQLARRVSFLKTHLFSSSEFTFRNAARASTLTGRLYKWLLCHIRYFSAVSAYRDALAGAAASAAHEKSFEWSSITDASISQLDASIIHEPPAMKLLLNMGKVIRIPRSAIYAKLLYNGAGEEAPQLRPQKILDLYKDQLDAIRKLSVQRWCVESERAQPSSLHSSSTGSSIPSYGSARELRNVPQQPAAPQSSEDVVASALEASLLAPLEGDEQHHRRIILMDQVDALFDLHVDYMKELVLCSVPSTSPSLSSPPGGLPLKNAHTLTCGVGCDNDQENEEEDEQNGVAVSHSSGRSSPTDVPSSEATRRSIHTATSSSSPPREDDSRSGGRAVLVPVVSAPSPAPDSLEYSTDVHCVSSLTQGMEASVVPLPAAAASQHSSSNEADYRLEVPLVALLHEEIVNREVLRERETHQWLHILSEALNELQDAQRTQRLKVYAKDMEKSRSMCREMQVQCMQSAQELCDILNADLIYGGLSSSTLVRHVEDVCSRLGDVSDYNTLEVSHLPEDIKFDLQDHFTDVRQSLQLRHVTGLSLSDSGESAPRSTSGSGLDGVDVVQEAQHQNREIKKIANLLEELRESQDVPPVRIVLDPVGGVAMPARMALSEIASRSTRSTVGSHVPPSPTIVALNPEEEDDNNIENNNNNNKDTVIDIAREGHEEKEKEENGDEEQKDEVREGFNDHDSTPSIITAQIELNKPQEEATRSDPASTSGRSSHPTGEMKSAGSTSAESSSPSMRESALPPLFSPNPSESCASLLQSAMKHVQELLLHYRKEGGRPNYFDSTEKKYADQIEQLIEEERLTQEKNKTNGSSPDPFSSARVRVLRQLRSHMLSLASAEEIQFLHFGNAISALSAATLAMLQKVPLVQLYDSEEVGGRAPFSPMNVRHYKRIITTPFCEHAEEYLCQLRYAVLQDLRQRLPLLEGCVSHLEVTAPTPTSLQVDFDVTFLPSLLETETPRPSLVEDRRRASQDAAQEEGDGDDELQHKSDDGGLSTLVSMVGQAVDTCTFSSTIAVLNDPSQILTIPDAFRQTLLALQFFLSK